MTEANTEVTTEAVRSTTGKTLKAEWLQVFYVALLNW